MKIVETILYKTSKNIFKKNAKVDIKMVPCSIEVSNQLLSIAVNNYYSYDSFFKKISKILNEKKFLRVLNLGSGKLLIPGAINLDRKKMEGVNLISDLRYGLPFDNNSFDLIVVFNVLEHLTVEEFEHVLKEIQRISKHDGLVKIHVPFFSSESAFSTIDHRIFFAYNTFFRYKIGDWDETTEKLFEDVKVHLIWHTNKYLSVLNFCISKIVNAHYLISMFYQHFFCWIFPMRSIDIVAIVKKDK